MYTLTLLSATLADLGGETGLDGSDTTSGLAFVAGDEVETVFTLVEFRVWGAAGLASYILHDVSTQNVFDLLLLETTLDDETLASINTTTGTQLSKEVRGDVLIGSLHALADLRDVGEDGLLVTFTKTLWWRDLVASGTARCVVWVLLGEKGEESVEEKVVDNWLSIIVCPDTNSILHVILIEYLGLSGGVGSC